MTLGGKGVYLNPKDGDEGYAIAAGGGAELPLGQYFTLFGEGITRRTQCPAASMIMWRPMPDYALTCSRL
jgi:hypothetical protein